MSNIIKTIIVVIVFIAIVFTAILFLVPGIENAAGRAETLIQHEEEYRNLVEEEERLKSLIDNIYVLKAKDEVLTYKLPYEHNISRLTNELYEIARVSDIQINTLEHLEVKINDPDEKQKSPISIFETDMVLQGSYYNIINFIYTLEIMPRISIVENMLIQADNEDHEVLSIFLTLRSYYLRDEF